MSQAIELQASLRQGTGTGDSRSLRRQEQLPGVVYGGSMEPSHIALDALSLHKAYLLGGFYSKVVNLKLGNEIIRVLPREVQLHPVTDAPLHADFLRLVKGHKVTVNVRVIVKNADKSPGIKRGGNLNLVRHEVQFECDSEHIPDSIIVDVGGLEIGDSVHISHIQLPQGATPTIKDRDFTVATIVGRISETEAQAGAETAAAPAAAPGKAAPAKAAPAKAPAKSDKK